MLISLPQHDALIKQSMELTPRNKPKPGERWVYLTGQHIEIVAITVDPDSDIEYVVYRKDGSYAPLGTLEMDDFMATLKESNNVEIPYFQKA